MDLSGSSMGTAAMFLLGLLSALASLAEAYSYSYDLVPRVELIVDRQEYASLDGVYLGGNTKELATKLLIFVDDPYFGCTEANQTDVPPSYTVDSVFLLPDTSHCSLYEKTRFASKIYSADGMIFYRPIQANASATSMSYSGPTEVTSETRKRQTSSRSSTTVVRLALTAAQLAELSFRQRTGSALQVNIKFELRQRNFNTSSTFYFVVFAFCILMMLSCSWLLLSYFKRCHYRWRVRRNQARSANETRAMVNRLPTKSYKSSKETEDVPTCVVCLEAFKNHDSIRILPCKHEFHRKCVDPWLKMKRNCPMCKQDISPPKRRQSSSSSSSSSRPQANTENGQRRAAGTSVDPHEQEVVLATTTTNDQQRGSGNEIVEDRISVRSSSLSSQETDTSATPLLAEAGSTVSVYGGETTAVIMLAPVATEIEREQVDGDQEITVIDIEDAPPTADDGATSTAAGGEGERDVSVDIEGGLPHESGPAPVVNA